MMRSRVAWHAGSLLIVVLIVVAWHLVASARLVSPAFLPSPERTWTAIVRAYGSGDLFTRLGATLWRMVVGWALASLLGVTFGALIGSISSLRRATSVLLEFLRPLPASATIPVFIVVMGLTNTMVLSVIAFGALWPMLLATVHGFESVEPRLYDVAQVLKLSRLATVFKIALPSALPDLISGLRLGLTVALILTVVCEMLVGVDGIGSWTLLSARAYRSPDLFAGVIILGLIGFGGSAVLSAMVHATQHMLRRA